jgi:hypothetical protein
MNHFYVEMTKVAGVDNGHGAGTALTAGGVAAGLGVGHVILGNTRLLPSAFLGDFNAHVAANGGERGAVERWSNRKARKIMSEIPAKDLRKGVYAAALSPSMLLENPELPARLLTTGGAVMAGSALAGGIVAHAIGSHFTHRE